MARKQKKRKKGEEKLKTAVLELPHVHDSAKGRVQAGCGPSRCDNRLQNLKFTFDPHPP
jgi:hypothetical protein